MSLYPRLPSTSGVSGPTPGPSAGHSPSPLFRRAATPVLCALTWWLGLATILSTSGWAESSTHPSQSDRPPSDSDEIAATPDSTRGRPVPSLSTPSREATLVWTTMTTPSGREVRVLRPEVADSKATASPQTAAPTSGRISDLPNSQSGAPPRSPDLRGMDTYLNPGPSVPRIAAFGVYGGYPSALGFQTVYPTDAPLAFRMGLTGFPTVGWLWTPGLELRFGQTKGRFNTDGVYHFSNLYIGQTTAGTDKDHWGAESGFGFRWLLPDRRGVRWIAAIEMGGRWTTESGLPDTPSVRAFWMIAAP